MGKAKLTATEASAVAAITVGVTFAVSEAYIAAAVAGLVGVALFFAYEHLRMEDISIDEDLVRDIAETSEEELETLLEEGELDLDDLDLEELDLEELDLEELTGSDK